MLTGVIPVHRTRPGVPSPLGSAWDGRGTNFALYSENATAVELCLFDDAGQETRREVRHRTDHVWHLYLEGVGPGQLYGYRVHGPWEPERGLRFNPRNVLLDPYAKALGGKESWERGVFSYDPSHPEKDLAAVQSDQRGAPLGVVVDTSFDWEDDAPPNIPMRESIIYEAHVKGLTMRHPEIAAELRGTYSAVAGEPIVRHLRELGVTALEVLPVHGFVDDKVLLDRGLRNYWGYNSVAFFAPDVRYRAGAAVAAEVRQFKQMVKTLHAAGIEVILDVVYNHTAEGNHLGPAFSFKGIDNPTYYRLVPDTPRYYFDYTGTGNSLNVRHPQTLRLIMDSLRYWVEEMHVDGFRFDLAATLARSLHEVDRLSSFFTVIHQDPVLARVKLIAEPWDVGEGGYQVGHFPVRWAEWNGKYRDLIRAFWKGDGGRAAELGYRLTGSSDLYQQGGRRPSASVNFITAHDGFTLHDLVSYDHKHNEANGEDNKDGADDNRSWNCGVEGETDDPDVLLLRRRQARNFLATLLLSQGAPMLCGGDEVGRTQRGNNNAYCQDSEISWHDWSPHPERKGLLAFTQSLIRLRRDHPLLHRASFFKGREIRGVGVHDLAWVRHDGEPMTDEDWANPGTQSLGMFMAASGLEPTDEEGRPQSDDNLLLLVNASHTDLDFILPAFVERGRAVPWVRLVSTAEDAGPEQVDPGTSTHLVGQSLKLFSRRALGPGGLQGAYGAPVSTYRLQLREGFGFEEARALSSYLDDLGAGGVYTSPYLRAEKGSTHGYDVVDHAALNPELGTQAQYEAWTDDLKARGLRHVTDFVPNHVGIGSGENRWWIDVLENGPSSTYAEYFDIDWDPAATAHKGKVLLPVLGRQFGEEVDDGKIGVARRGGAFWVTYYDRSLPASPRSYALVLERAMRAVDLARDDAHLLELESILGSIRHLPGSDVTCAERRIERSRELDVIKRRIDELCAASPPIAQAVDQAAASIAESPERLEQFLGEQSYRLAYWRVATEEINYRRFFDINDLAAIRMEDPEVFAAAHAKLLDLVAEGRVTGLRLDHTDGLYDPHAYFQALQAAAREALRRGGLPAGAPIFAVAEKILEPGEELPRSWSISGTTGYDFLAAINGVWVDPEGERPLTDLYAGVTGERVDYRAVVYLAKRDLMAGTFSSEVHLLAQALKRIADKSRRARDFTLAGLVRVIRETIAAFPVYRTYVRPDGAREAHDEEHIRAAIRLARRKNPTLERTTFEFLEDVLLLHDHSDEAVRFAMRFQQVTGPIMAKGVEDTATYRFARLLSANEVGCDAFAMSSTVQALHAHNVKVLACWPLAMTTTTTHDTKRSEDVRGRLAVLSEAREEWTALVLRVRDLLAGAREDLQGLDVPTAVDEYIFLQTVAGAWPFQPEPDFEERIASYMLKAVREAKVHTSWSAPDAAYEEGVTRFVRTALRDPATCEAISGFVKKTLSTWGATNSLAQLAVRMASPGVPDVYQGTELWDLSLVDPDNRRPVDYAKRSAMLADLKARGKPRPELAKELVQGFADGRIKLHTLRTCLRLRREHASLFLDGGYASIDAGEHVIAFERTLGERRLVCVAPRLMRRRTGGRVDWPLGNAWENDRLELGDAARFVNVFTGETHEGASLPLSRVFATFPVAWLFN